MARGRRKHTNSIVKDVALEASFTVVVSETGAGSARGVARLALTVNQGETVGANSTIIVIGATAGFTRLVTRRTFTGGVDGREFRGQIITFLAVFVRGASSGVVAIAIGVASAVNFIKLVIPADAIWWHTVSVLKNQIIRALGTFSGFGTTAFEARLIADRRRVNTFTVLKDFVGRAGEAVLSIDIRAGKASGVASLAFSTDEDSTIWAVSAIVG